MSHSCDQEPENHEELITTRLQLMSPKKGYNESSWNCQLFILLNSLPLLFSSSFSCKLVVYKHHRGETQDKRD